MDRPKQSFLHVLSLRHLLRLSLLSSYLSTIRPNDSQLHSFFFVSSQPQFTSLSYRLYFCRWFLHDRGLRCQKSLILPTFLKILLLFHLFLFVIFSVSFSLSSLFYFTSYRFQFIQHFQALNPPSLILEAF